MNLKFANDESNHVFSNALIDSKVVQNWLINKLTSYSSKIFPNVTLEIMIEPWVKTEKPSFAWTIYCDSDSSELPYTSIINGGLIYRGQNESGKDTYSSHT